jgi:hypothetical protein
VTLYGVHFLVVFPLCMNYALNIWRVYYIQKMAEQNGDGYIKCAGCKCKYNNDGDSIKAHFGFNRLNEQLKTCVKCRNCRAQYQQDNFDKLAQKKHQYWIDNKDTIHTQRHELIRTADESNGTVKYCNRCYKNKPVIDFVCPNGKSYNACYPCLERKYG